MEWSDNDLKELRERIRFARKEGLFVSAAEARMITDLIFAYRVIMVRSGAFGAPYGRMPTVGDCKLNHIHSFVVICEGMHCYAKREFSFKELKIPDDVVFVEIPKRYRFRCIKCGSHKVSVMAKQLPQDLLHRATLLSEAEREIMWASYDRAQSGKGDRACD